MFPNKKPPTASEALASDLPVMASQGERKAPLFMAKKPAKKAAKKGKAPPFAKKAAKKVPAKAAKKSAKKAAKRPFGR